MLFLAAVAAFLWLSRRDSEVAAVRRYEALRKPGQAPRKQAVYSFMQQLYSVCEQMPVLRMYLQHLRRRLVILRLGDEWKLRLEVMKSALLMWLVLFLAAIPLVLAVRDPYTLAMLGIGLWVGHGILSDMGVYRLEMRLLRQLRLFLGDVRHHYHRHGMVDEAVYESADSAPYEMALHGQELFDMLTDSDAEDKLAQYVEHAPNRYLQGFAGLSYLIKEHGDQQTESGSVYLKGLEKLSIELNLELLRRERLSFLLQGLTVIALLPLLFTRPIEAWASHFFRQWTRSTPALSVGPPNSVCLSSCGFATSCCATCRSWMRPQGPPPPAEKDGSNGSMAGRGCAGWPTGWGRFQAREKRNG